MDTITINFKASGQNLTADAHPQRYASNTVNYIQAVFDLDENWQSFDSVRAVWHNDFTCISTVLDGSGACTVPHEVLTNLDEVIVNLVGSNVEGEELVDRMTTYPLRVVIIDAHARICGTETAEVTPSQFEQYIAIVEQIVGTVKDIDHTELTDDYCLIIYYSDGTNSGKLGPIRGATGATGNGIVSAVLNSDYTLTLTYDNGDSDTVGPIRGPQGEPGEVTLAQLESVLPTDTASGSIASFPDGSDLFDYLSCVCDIEPVQDLHGYGKPWVGGAGKNKFSNVLSDYDNATSYGFSSYIEVEFPQNTIVTISTDAPTGYIWAGTNISTDYIRVYAGEPITRTLTNGTLYVGILTTDKAGALAYKNQIEIGSTATAYEPYSNICPITGWTGCEVDVCGVNVWDEEWEVGGINETTGQSSTDSSRIRSVNYIAVKPNTSYYFAHPNSAKIFYYDTDKTLVGQSTWDAQTAYTLPSNCYYVRFAMGFAYGTTYNNDISINYPSTDHDYHAYTGTTYEADLGRTVYGGTVDLVSGVLTVTGSYLKLNTATLGGSDSWPSWINCGVRPLVGEGLNNVITGSLSSITDTVYANTTGTNDILFLNSATLGKTKSELIEMAIDVDFYIPLATPTTYQLTPQTIQTLLGNNNVWADCGNVEVTYKADVQRWVEKKLGA